MEEVAHSKLYSESNYHTLRHSVSDKAFELIARYRAEKFQRFITPDSRVLEFGCGPGWNLIQLKANRRVGCDVAAQYAESIRARGVEFTSCMTMLAGQKFDFVFSSHVLEHVLDPATILQQLAHFLRPNAKLLVIVPLDKVRRRHDPKNTNHHLRIWDVHTLTELAMACGYRVESCSIHRYGFDRFAANLIARLPFASYRAYRALMGLCRMIVRAREIRMVLSPLVSS